MSKRFAYSYSRRSSIGQLDCRPATCNWRLHGWRLHALATTRVSQDVLRSVGDELSAESSADGDGLAKRTTRLTAHDSAAVERDDGGDELEAVVADGRRQRADRCLTSAAKRCDQRPLGIERGGRGRIINTRHDTPDPFVSLPNLDRHNALSWRRNASRDGQRERDTRSESEPSKPGGGQHDRVVLADVELAKTRVDISADGREPRTWNEPHQLRDTTHAAGANRGRWSKMREEILDRAHGPAKAGHYR